MAEMKMERYRSLIEHTLDIITILQADGITRYANPAVQAVLGYRPEELIGQNAFRFIHTDDLPAVKAAIARGIPRPGASAVVEFRFLHKDGSWRNLEGVGSNLLDDPSVAGIIVNCRDVTAKKLAEQALRRERDLSAAVLDTVGALIVVMDTEGRIVRFNRACERLSGYSETEVRGQKCWELLVPAEQAGAVQRHFSKLAAGDYPGQHENCWVTRDGTRRWIAWSNTALTAPDGALEYVIGTGLDVTERKHASEAMRALNARLLAAGEEERRHISRELHDDLNQRLALLGMELDALVNDPLFPANSSRSRLRSVQAQLVDVSEWVRSVAYQLHPAILDELGLVPALSSLASEFSRRGGIVVQFRHRTVPVPLAPAVALCLFRVAQECLRNVARHAEARRAVVLLEGRPEEIRLRVTDSGKGFDPSSSRPASGLGLISMQERVRLAGGALEIRSRLGRGTSVEARIPLPETS